MNCERSKFILALVLGFGLTSGLMAQADISITETCAGFLKSEGVFAGINADTVGPTILIEQPDPDDSTPSETSPAKVTAHQLFCPAPDNSCQRHGRWSFGVGDDFPLNGLAGNPPPAGECSYTFGPGAFPLSTVGDWSGGNQFCMVVSNCDNNGVAARAIMLSSLGNVGVALQIRTLSQSREEWIEPGKSKTICVNFDAALVEPNLGENDALAAVPNINNVTGFGFEFGAYVEGTEMRDNCLDGNKDNNPPDCLNKPPAGPGLNRESNNVCVKLEQPRPMMVLEDQELVFCNSETLTATIFNPGTGTLFITKANVSGDDGEFEAQQTLAVPPGERREYGVRYNNRAVGTHHAAVRFESNALDSNNLPVNPNDAALTLDVHAFSTLAYNIETVQNTATSFTARVVMQLSEFAPTGFAGVASGDEEIFAGTCGRITQIASTAARLGFDPSKIEVTGVEVGRPTAEPNGAVSGVDTTDIAPLPCCVTDDSDPPLNESVEWQVLYNTPLTQANAQGRVDAVMADIGGVILDTEFYVNNFPTDLAPDGTEYVLVECFSADFELLSLTGCNTATVFFDEGPSDNFFPSGHQSNVGENPLGNLQTTRLQDVGAKSARSLGIPPNSFVRGDVDFSAQPNANDIVRLANIIFNTDGSEGQIIAIIGRNCVDAADITTDRSVDIRDLLTLIQLLFNITSNVTPTDIQPLFDRQVTKASDLGKRVEIPWPGAGYENQVPNNDTSADDVKPDPGRYTCDEGLDCEENGV